MRLHWADRPPAGKLQMFHFRGLKTAVYIFSTDALRRQLAYSKEKQTFHLRGSRTSWFECVCFFHWADIPPAGKKQKHPSPSLSLSLIVFITAAKFGSGWNFHPGKQPAIRLKIASKCKRHFIALQAGKSEPFIDEIVRTLRKITQDLSPQQVHTFNEACGHMISAQGQKMVQE